MLTIITQRLNRKLHREREKYSAGPLEIYYFGYGANIDPDFFASRITHHEFVGVGTLQDYELKFNTPCEYKGKGFAGVVESKGSKVYGTVYKISKEGLELLDWMEWVPFKFYYRKQLDILIDKNILKAEVYVPCHPSKNLYPPKGYISLITKGAYKLNFPIDFIQFLERTETRTHFELNNKFNLNNPARSRILPSFMYYYLDIVREFMCKYL